METNLELINTRTPRIENKLEDLATFKQVVDQVDDLVMITDLHGNIEYVNPAFERISGYSKYEALGQKPNILKSGKQETSFYENLWKTVLEGRSYHGLLVNKRKDGSLFYAEKTITPLKNKEGDIAHFVSTDKDVTERRITEERANLYVKKFKDLFDNSGDAMAYCALDGTLLEVNHAFIDMTGYSTEELLHQKKYQDITNEEFWEIGNQFLSQLLSQGKSITYEKEYIRKDGKTVPVLLTAFPVREDHTPRITAVGVIAIDITERRNFEIKLKDLNSELKRSNEDLDRFACIAAHDLQAPLRTISLYLGLIERGGGLDTESKEYLTYTKDACKRLSSLISDLLTYSRVLGTVTKWEAVNLEETLASVLELQKDTVKRLQAKISHDPLPEIQGDPTQLSIILANLIENGMKYRRENEAPRIHVGAKRVNGEYLFSVKDNGLGVSKEDTEKIFLMFQRGKNGYTIEGTGIGLAICKRAIEAHGGKVWVESIPGAGSTFFFTIPVHGYQKKNVLHT